MENMLEEVLWVVGKYCRAEDLKHLACCNKQWSSRVRPILWQSVCLDLQKIFEKSPHNPREHSHHVLQKIFQRKRNDSALAQMDFIDPSVEELLNRQRSDPEIEQKALEELTRSRKSLVKDFENLKYTIRLCVKNTLMIDQVSIESVELLFNCCNAAKVKSLIVDDETGSLFSEAVRSFPNIENLEIRSGARGHPLAQKLPPLKQLKSFTNLMTVDTSSLKLVFGQSDLKSLMVALWGVEEPALQLIGRQESLDKLSIGFCVTSNSYHWLNAEPEREINLTPLSQLCNLTFLEIRHLPAYSEKSLVSLCHNLQQLEVLIFRDAPKLRDWSLREIHRLSSLTDLILESTKDLTSESLQYIGMMRNLSFLTFDATMCNDDRAFQRVGFLNLIPTLYNVVLHVNSEATKVMDAVSGLV